MPSMSNVHVIDHPLVQHKLTLMRKKDASTNSFRRLLGELSTLMAYEVTRDMPLQDIEIETPLERMTGKVIDGKKLGTTPWQTSRPAQSGTFVVRLRKPGYQRKTLTLNLNQDDSRQEILAPLPKGARGKSEGIYIDD